MPTQRACNYRQCRDRNCSTAKRHEVEGSAQQLGDEVRIVRELELSAPMRLEPVRLPDATDRAGTDAALPRHQVGPVGRLGRLATNVSATTRSATSGPSSGIREGRLNYAGGVDAFFHEPLLPAPDADLDVSVRRMSSLAPTPSALGSTIAARQTCLCVEFRSSVIASSRRRSGRMIMMKIPALMRKTRT